MYDFDAKCMREGGRGQGGVSLGSDFFLSFLSFFASEVEGVLLLGPVVEVGRGGPSAEKAARKRLSTLASGARAEASFSCNG